jgi:hypothetical protein
MIPSKEKIEEIIKELQRIMRIQDWDIEFDFCGDKKIQELTGDFYYACCERNIKLCKATIYVNKDHEGIDDWYPTLIHEMYHIVTNNMYYHAISLLDYISDGVARDKESNMFKNYNENMVELLAKGFVNAYPVTNFIKEVQNATE